MTIIDYCRVLSMIVWATIALSRLCNIWRVVVGRAKFYDVLWSVIGCVGFNIVGFNLRWFLSGDTTEFWIALYAFSAVLGCMTLRAIYMYQRVADYGR